MTAILAAVVLIALMALLTVRGSASERRAPDDGDTDPDPDEANPPHWWGADR